MNTEKRLNTYEGRWKTNVVLNVDPECARISVDVLEQWSSNLAP